MTRLSKKPHRFIGLFCGGYPISIGCGLKSHRLHFNGQVDESEIAEAPVSKTDVLGSAILLLATNLTAVWTKAKLAEALDLRSNVLGGAIPFTATI